MCLELDAGLFDGDLPGVYGRKGRMDMDGGSCFPLFSGSTVTWVLRADRAMVMPVLADDRNAPREGVGQWEELRHLFDRMSEFDAQI
jgi:hypothetical protein